MERVDLRDNEFVERFVGSNHVDSRDEQFWHQLLSGSFNFMRVQDPQMVDRTLDPYLVRLTLNNSESLNIGSLIRVFIDRVSKIRTSSGKTTNPYYIFQSFNALYLLRTICKSYIQNLSEEKLVKSLKAKVDAIQAPTEVQISSPQVTDGTHELNNKIDDVTEKPDITSGSVMLDQFISTLIAIIVDIPLDDSTYLIQVESINALLVLLSVQMYSTQAADHSLIYKCIMQKRCSIHSLVLTKTLLNNFVAQVPAPQESGSLIIGLASGIWKVLSLGIVSSQPEDESSMPLLAKQSLLLLNILTNHCTAERNPYREAITSCQDSQYDVADAESANNDALVSAASSKSVLVKNRIKIDLHKLYETICAHASNDQVALLLYLLLQGNRIFRPYILTKVSSELDRLLLPLLKTLYCPIEKGSHLVYMVLIILIILSEEELFNNSINNIIVRNVPWYKDRVLNDISLGSLTTLILIRSFQYNTFRIRDKFLHKNLYATVANLSNHFSKLHPYVCQRLVDFLERLGKRYLTLTRASENPRGTSSHGPNSPCSPLVRALASDPQDVMDASSLELNSSNTLNSIQTNGTTININMSSDERQDQPEIVPEQETTPTSQQDQHMSHHSIILPTNNSGSSKEYAVEEQQSLNSDTSNNEGSFKICIDNTYQDVEFLAEVIRMLLEIINNSLMVRMADNPDLIYTLLYKRNVFNGLLSSHPSFYNLVINVERVLTYSYNQIEAFARPLSEIEIKNLISSTAAKWKFANESDTQTKLLFRYVEDEQPEDFFVPYIWTRVYYSSGIFWEPRRIQIFNAEDV